MILVIPTVILLNIKILAFIESGPELRRLLEYRG